MKWLAAEGGQRGRGVGDRTIVVTLGTVRQVLAYAVAEGLIATNPAAGVKAPRKQRSDAREVVVWPIADMLALRDVADADEWAAGWRLTLSGLRRSEVLGMRWQSLSLTDGTVTVEAGAGRARRAPHRDRRTQERSVVAHRPGGGDAPRHNGDAAKSVSAAG